MKYCIMHYGIRTIMTWCIWYYEIYYPKFLDVRNIIYAILYSVENSDAFYKGKPIEFQLLAAWICHIY